MPAPLDILLVDDEDGILTVLSLLLADMGHSVRTASGGTKALELYRQRKADVVITDVRMPGMDGIALLDALKSLNPNAEVLLLTGHGDVDLAVAGLRHGAGDFLSKPIADAALEVALERAGQRLTLREALRRHTEELEDLVKQRTAELIESERFAAVGESAAGTAHALKNIAGALQGTMFVLEKGLELDKREYFEQGWQMIREDVERLKNLALELLNLGTKRSLVFAPTRPHEPARQVLESLSARAREAGVALESAFEAGDEAFVLSPEGVHECLFNLVLNALEAFDVQGTEARGQQPLVRLAVRREMCANGSRGLAYTVTDNGPGLPGLEPGEDFSHNLPPGFHSGKQGGSGIGLFATRKTAREMGAELVFQSPPEGGLEVRLVLPLRTAS